MTTELNTSHSTLAGSKDKLLGDIRGIGSDAGDLAKEVVSFAANEYASGRKKVEISLDEARNRLGEVRGKVGEQARAAADATHDYVGAHPWQALGLTALAGLVIGYLFRRP